MPDGTFEYTRDGTFQMDNQGRIVTAQGNPVQPTITIPHNALGLTINEQGQVSVTLPGSSTSAVLGQIGADPLHQQGRPAAGRQQPVHRNALLRPAAGRHRQRRRLRQHQQGSLEQANVDVVSEMCDLIAAQRAYEMNAKVISAADQMMQSTTALFR